MPQLSSEMLVYGLVIAAFLLFNYVMQQVAKKARQAQADAAASAPTQATTDEAAEEYAWRRGPGVSPSADEPEQYVWGPASSPRSAREPSRGIEPPALEVLAPPAAARRRNPHHLFATKKDLRQAIVVMTVLGPCRALDPPEYR